MNKKHKPSAGTLTLSNSAILSLPAEALAAAIDRFLSQPLPILARVDLKTAAEAILARARVLHEAHVDLIKKHGGAEDPPNSGIWRLSRDNPGYAAFVAEFDTLCSGNCTLPLTAKVRLPAKVHYQGREMELVMDGPAAALFGDIVEVVG